MKPKWVLTGNEGTEVFCMKRCQATEECPKDHYCASKEGLCIPPCKLPNHADVTYQNQTDYNKIKNNWATYLQGMQSYKPDRVTLTCKHGYVLADGPEEKTVSVSCKFYPQDGTHWRPERLDGKYHPEAICKRGKIMKISQNISLKLSCSLLNAHALYHRMLLR